LNIRKEIKDRKEVERPLFLCAEFGEEIKV